MGYDGRHRKERKQHPRKAAAYSAAAIAVAVPTTTSGHLPAITTNTFPRITAEKSVADIHPAAKANHEIDPAIASFELGKEVAARAEEERRHKAYLRFLAARRAERAREAQTLAAVVSTPAPVSSPSPSSTATHKAASAATSTKPKPTFTLTASPSTTEAAKAIAFAFAQLGKPYIWGGTGPGGFDCSGLVQAAWAYAGVSIPRTSEEQWAGLTHVSASNMEPGDILVFYSGASHVGLYIGNGYMIDASHSGVPIEKVAIAGYYMSNLLGVVRP